MIGSAEIWMIILAITVALPASLLGVFLILKKMVMVADAISHAVLPGIVVAYLISRELSGWQFVVGSIIAAIISSTGIRWLQRKFNTQEDAAIGTVFTSFFALGVILIALYTGKNTDIDQECVLYGDLETTVLYHTVRNGFDIGPQAFYTMLPLTILIVLISSVFLPQWRAVLFDSNFVKSIGGKEKRWEWILLLLVSIHSVLCFDSVGVVMVVGLLVLPSSTAIVLVKRLSSALWISAIVSVVSCIVGVLLAIQYNFSVAPIIVTVNAIILALTVTIKSVSSNLKGIST